MGGGGETPSNGLASHLEGGSDDPSRFMLRIPESSAGLDEPVETIEWIGHDFTFSLTKEEGSTVRLRTVNLRTVIAFSFSKACAWGKAG